MSSSRILAILHKILRHVEGESSRGIHRVISMVRCHEDATDCHPESRKHRAALFQRHAAMVVIQADRSGNLDLREHFAVRRGLLSFWRYSTNSFAPNRLRICRTSYWILRRLVGSRMSRTFASQSPSSVHRFCSLQGGTVVLSNVRGVSLVAISRSRLCYGGTLS
jgi:hypothetical protein